MCVHRRLSMMHVIAGPGATTLVELAAAARACKRADQHSESSTAPACCRATEQRLFNSLHPPATAPSQEASEGAASAAAALAGPQEAGVRTRLDDLSQPLPTVKPTRGHIHVVVCVLAVPGHPLR